MRRTTEDCIADMKRLEPTMAELRDLNDDADREWTESDQRTFDETVSRYEELEKERQHLERNEKLTRRLMGADFNGQGRDLVPGVHTSRGSGPPPVNRPLERGESIESRTRNELEARGDRHGLSFDRWHPGDFIAAMLDARHPRHLEARQQQGGSDPAGGFIVPTLLASQVYDLMRAQMVTAQAGVTLFPVGSDTHTIASIVGDPVSTWRAELSAINEDTITFGSVTMAPKSLAVIVRSSWELIEDSTAGGGIGALVSQVLASSFATELDRVVLNGSGVGEEPTGLLQYAGLQEISTVGALADYDPFVNLLDALQKANVPAADIGAAIVPPEHDKDLSLLKDTTNQPLRPPVALEGKPFLVTTSVPDGSALMGRWADALLGLRTSFRIQVLRERYADVGQTAWVGWLRADFQMPRPGNMGKLTGIT